MVVLFQMVRSRQQYPITLSPLHTMEDYHVYYTLNDLEFQSEVRKMAHLAKNNIDVGNPYVDAFMNKYCIPISEIKRYLEYGKRGKWFNPRPRWSLHRSSDNRDEWMITFDKAAMQSDFINAYEQFDVMRRDIYPELSVRRRAPAYPCLIYAIFCQRRVNTRWREIFQMYQAGTLPRYRGSCTQYGTQRSLEAHYKRHRPTPV